MITTSAFYTISWSLFPMVKINTCGRQPRRGSHIIVPTNLHDRRWWTLTSFAAHQPSTPSDSILQIWPSSDVMKNPTITDSFTGFPINKCDFPLRAVGSLYLLGTTNTSSTSHPHPGLDIHRKLNDPKEVLRRDRGEPWLDFEGHIPGPSFWNCWFILVQWVISTYIIWYNDQCHSLPLLNL